MSELIEFKNVTKEYKTGDHVLKAANKLNFTINEGKFVVILGPSGSGKSTLLNLLGGLDNVTSGDIIVNGKTISEFSDKELTKYRACDIGFIFQFYNLLPSLTSLENIELLNDISDRKIDGMKVLSQVGLADHANQFPSELSGGEQQRVSIARGIAKNPQMLLCDKPTGTLESMAMSYLKVLNSLTYFLGTLKSLIVIDFTSTGNQFTLQRESRRDKIRIHRNTMPPYSTTGLKNIHLEQLQHGEVTRQVFQLQIAFLRPAAVFFLPGAPDFFQPVVHPSFVQKPDIVP